MSISGDKLRGLDALFDDEPRREDVVHVGIAVLRLPIFDDDEEALAICAVHYDDDGDLDDLEPIGYFFDERGASIFSKYVKSAISGECKSNVVTADEVEGLDDAINEMKRWAKGES